MPESGPFRLPATLRRYLRTPKGVLLVILTLLVALAGWQGGLALTMPGLAAGGVAGMLLDAPILRLRKRRWVFPDGALLTGMLVAMVLSPHEPWYVAALTSGVGVVSKYLFRAGTANIFNPAALGLVATFYLFDTGQSWWGALPEVTPPALGLVVLMGSGLFLALRVNKLPGLLAFLGTYYFLASAVAFLGDPARVAELYRTPDLHAALFLACFMVTDPPTSPPRPRDQVVFGVLTAMGGWAVFELVGAAYYLLAGILVANLWEGWRRARARARRRGQPVRGEAPAR